MEILDTKITQTLRRLFEGTATLERSNKETIVEVCREYNNQIEELCQSMGYKISKTISDLFTKHIFAVSLGVFGVFSGNFAPGLASLIIGKVTQKIVESVSTKVSNLTDKASKSLTHVLTELLGKDSDLIHLCITREALKKIRTS